ncbi:MAG TPA: carboxypeptidase regulatory-like domain-containing protein [Gemmatimonadales bacterium]|nr:carboxypeptidase regulatory-like domain-containing protein [Gemmatimonadales bacterium]
MRHLQLTVVMGVLAAPGVLSQNAPAAAASHVSGTVAILEKHNKTSPDIGDAVVYLTAASGGNESGGRPVTMDVTISDKKFAPDVVVVPVGSTVRFPNTDPFSHNVFSASDPNAFDLGLYGRGEAKGHVFDHAGLVYIYCNVHSSMVAYVQVMGSRWFAQPGADGSFTIAGVPPGHYSLHVWHPRVAQETVQEVDVPAAGLTLPQPVQLDARGFRQQAHKNKFGKPYPTNAGRELY